MITLPVTAQMYHSLVQQQIPNSDNTVCVTPMQVQNLISNNNLCSSIANSNLNATTTYIMTTNNRNVINLPLQVPSGHMKAIITNTPNLYAPKNRNSFKKSFLKRKIINLTPKPKICGIANHTFDESLAKPKVNNNSSNIRNKNQKIDEKYSSIKSDTESKKCNSESKTISLIDEPDDTTVKEENDSIDDKD